jgi:hypothetical protein
MSAEAVAIALLSGGFVGVVFKSGFDRAERFRDRMYAAADAFLTAGDTALDSLDLAARTYLELREAMDEWHAASERTEAILEGYEVVDEGGGPAARLSALLTDLTGEVPGSAERVRQALDELRDEWRSSVKEKPVLEALDDVLNAARRWVTLMEPMAAVAVQARLAVTRAYAVRARVALVYAGRWRHGDDVVEAAERVADPLRGMRTLLAESVNDEGDRLLGEWPSVVAEIESAVSDFAVKANRSARRFWL